MDEIPKLFYKYIRPEGAEVFLAKPQIHFTDWRKLDDLMEILPGAKPLTEVELDNEAARESRERHLPFALCRAMLAGLGQDYEWDRALRERFENQPCSLFINCLSARWNSGAMWALYAKEHTGIVFGVAYQDMPPRARALGKVNYSNQRPQLPMGKTDPVILLEAVRTKSVDWDYQEEWRSTDGSGEVESLSPGAVSEIIVGCRAMPKLIEQVNEFKRHSPKTRIFRAYPHPQFHEMARERI